MNKLILLLALLLFANISQAQNSQVINYELNHYPEKQKIEIVIQTQGLTPENPRLIIPRSGPGTYEMTDYISFVENVKGYTSNGTVIAGERGEGSYFNFNTDSKNQIVFSKISYEVDIKKMETSLLGGFASSKHRKNYLGLLGYSVFGFLEGLEEYPIQLTIKTTDDWPVFSTLRPSEDRNTGSDSYLTDNFALLADAQYLLGKDVQIYKVKETQIPLYVAAYTETPIDIKEIGRRGKLSLEGLADYFDYIPMPYYTMCYEFIKPYSNQHDYGFLMEHLNSMSACYDISRAITEYDSKARLGGIVHHMGHSWIPLRSYGSGYRPFEWQTAPLIETIWLNEGFTWYISFYKVLANKDILEFFNKVVDKAPQYIQKKSLKELSLLGSTQYGADFRIGRNLFSRGALMAYELDQEISKKSNGKRSFRDALLGLLTWTDKNQRAFNYNEIEPIMSEATGVDLSVIWRQWQEPMTIEDKN